MGGVGGGSGGEVCSTQIASVVVFMGTTLIKVNSEKMHYQHFSDNGGTRYLYRRDNAEHFRFVIAPWAVGSRFTKFLAENRI